MRRFIVIGHKAVTDSGFTLDDLCGSAGRLDVLIRALHSSLLLSHGIRRDTEILLVLLGKPIPPRIIRISGETVKYLNPDERSTGALLRQALAKSHHAPEDGEIETTPGMFISQGGLEDIQEMFSEENFVLLHQDGEDIRNADISPDSIFILSDHMEFTQENMNIIKHLRPNKVSLGPVVVHTHHAITLAHNELDRMAGKSSKDI